MESIFGGHVFSELQRGWHYILGPKNCFANSPRFLRFSFVLWKKYSLMAKVSYFIFSLEKILSHSLTPFRDLRYFFSGSGKKKIQSRNFRLFRFGPVNLGEPPQKWQKNDLMGYISEKIQIHIILSDFFVMKMVIDDLLSVFFFSEKVGSGKKKIPRFSLTHSFFEISILKVSFPGKK